MRRGLISHLCIVFYIILSLDLTLFAAEPDSTEQAFLSRIVALISNEARRLSLFDIEACSPPHPSIPVGILRYNARYGEYAELILVRHATLVIDSTRHPAFKSDDTFKAWISVTGEYVDFKKRKSLGDFQYLAVGSGRTQVKAERNALAKLRQQVRLEMKSIYWYSSEVRNISGKQFQIPGGSAHGLEPGMLFSIMHPAPEQLDQTAGSLPFGHRIGIATVVDTAADSSRLKIRRLWRPMDESCRVIERLDPLITGRIFTRISSISRNIGFAFETRPHCTFDWGFSVYYKQMADSRNERAYGFGFSGLGAIHLYRRAGVSFTLNSSLDMSFLFRKDDNDQVVGTPLFSFPVGLSSEWQMAPKYDLVLGVGYSFGTESTEWDYTDNETSVPAYWERRLPSIRDEGFYISSGIRYWFF